MVQNLFAKLWNDDNGALIAMEFLFIATILIIGIIVGLASVRGAVNAELSELAQAILALSQGYTISGVLGCCSEVQGSQANDLPGVLAGPSCTDNVVPVDIISNACN